MECLEIEGMGVEGIGVEGVDKEVTNIDFIDIAWSFNVKRCYRASFA